MSITSEITRIKNAKTDIATSIAKKGVTVPENAKIDEYSALIDDIQGNIDNTTKIIRDTVIAEKQFYQGVGLEGIKTVILPNVQTIGNLAFCASSEIETIDIGASVTSIGISAFTSCSSLKTLIFRGLLNQDTALMLTGVPISQKTGYIYVPDIYVEDYKSSTNKTLSRYTERIKSLKELGGGADVSGVTATADDVLKGKKIVTKDGELVAGTMPDRQAIAEVLGEGETITIPKGYHNGEGTVTAASIIKTIDETEIAESEYEYGKGLKGVTILNLPNVETIGEWAFYKAAALETVDIGKNITKILPVTFDGCSSLKTLIIRAPHTTSYGSQLNLLNTPIRDKADGAYIYVPDDYVEQYQNSGSFVVHKDRIKPLSELPSTKVTLNIINVNSGQFKDVKCIKKINLPCVEDIAGGAFTDSDIETLDIGSNVKNISTTALNGMSKLSTLIIRGKPTQITKLPLTNSLIWKGEGYIYVPDGYVEHFKTSVFTGTSPDPYNIVLADRVKPLSELKSDGGPLQSKTVTPGETSTKVTPDEGYYGLSDVTVEAIPDIYVENPFRGIDIEDIKGIIAEMTVVGNAQFEYVYLKEIRLPKVEQLGFYILGFNSITETLELGERLTRIEPYQISGCSSLKTLILQGICSLATDPYVTFSGTPIADGTGTVYVPDRYLERYKNDSLWSGIASQIKPLSEYYGIEVEGAVSGIDPTWTDWRYFSYYNNRNSLVAKLKYSDTSNGTNFASMFYDCSTLKSIPPIDTSNGTSFGSMFYDCYELSEAPQINTHNGTTFTNMFVKCRSLVEIPQLNTSNGTNFSNMFAYCENIKTIPLIDTSNGTNFGGMFAYCKNITQIPDLNTSKGTSFSNMFGECDALTIAPDLNTSNGTNLGSLFYNCKNLVTVPKLNASKVTSVTNCSNMFYRCSALENITFEGIFPVWGNTSVFSDCPNLTVGSLMSFINALVNKGTTTRTVTIGSINLAKLTPEQIQIATDKNITLA